MERSAAPYSGHISRRLQIEWKRLFTKQLYCIGKDIRHADNLLLQYGFTRQRPPNPDKGSSQYSLAEQDGRVILWGFGMVFATKNDGLFLWRHEFEPKLLNAGSLRPNLWDPDQLPQLAVPKTSREMSLMLQLLIGSTKWLEGYESWVLATCGQAYRNESLRGKHSSDSTHSRLDERWANLSKKFARCAQPASEEPGRGRAGPKISSPALGSAQGGKKFAASAG